MEKNMSINAILACDLNFGIGNEGNLPWPKNERDMAWFREQTLGHVVLMGRTTWESIGSKPLPKRENVVVTSKTLESADVTMSGDMEAIIKYVKELYDGLHIWIIGGADIYQQAIPFCDKLYLTTINKAYTCDRYVESDIITKFPVIEYWKEDEELTFQIRRR
jgi:dihydrofolate reductase